MQYYGFEMYEEYNMQTASGTAESDVSGVYMNMVTKSGGNRVTSDHNFYFMNDKLQGSNIDDPLRTRLGLGSGQQSGAAGNPIDVSYDWSSTLGGPIKRDKAWFFGALRRWRLDQFQIGAKNADGSQAIDGGSADRSTNRSRDADDDGEPFARHPGQSASTAAIGPAQASSDSGWGRRSLTGSG